MRAYGVGATADRLIGLATDWDAAGRPTLGQLRLRVYPRDDATRPAGREFAERLVISDEQRAQARSLLAAAGVRF